MATSDQPGEISLESGVSAFTGEGFVTLTFAQEDGTRRAMQMPPQQARQLGGWFFEVAEAAEHDAASMAALLDLGLEKEGAARFLASLRERRSGADDKET